MPQCGPQLFYHYLIFTKFTSNEATANKIIRPTLASSLDCLYVDARQTTALRLKFQTSSRMRPASYSKNVMNVTLTNAENPSKQKENLARLATQNDICQA